jgi:hypothetical protein
VFGNLTRQDLAGGAGGSASYDYDAARTSASAAAPSTARRS